MVVGLASCGMSVKSMEKKLEELEDEEDFEYDEAKKSDIKELKKGIEEEIDDLKGEIEAAYTVMDEDYKFAMVIFFEKSADAKMVGEDIEDLYDDAFDKFTYEVSGKVLIFGEKSIVKKIVE